MSTLKLLALAISHEAIDCSNATLSKVTLPMLRPTIPERSPPKRVDIEMTSANVVASNPVTDVWIHVERCRRNAKYLPPSSCDVSDSSRHSPNEIKNLRLRLHQKI